MVTWFSWPPDCRGTNVVRAEGESQAQKVMEFADGTDKPHEIPPQDPEFSFAPRLYTQLSGFVNQPVSLSDSHMQTHRQRTKIEKKKNTNVAGNFVRWQGHSTNSRIAQEEPEAYFVSCTQH